MVIETKTITCESTTYMNKLAMAKANPNKFYWVFLPLDVSLKPHKATRMGNPHFEIKCNKITPVMLNYSVMMYFPIITYRIL